MQTKTKNVAIVLSGCGVYDGSEIHEVVCTLLNVKRNGANAVFFAPDKPQSDVVNHLNGQEKTELRNVLEESARIARGEIKPLSEFNAKDFDALIFPGGFGAAKNLCTFAKDGASCSVDVSVERAITGMLECGKKIAFLCISPVIAAKVIGNGVRLTIGSDPSTAAAIEAMGAIHVSCEAGDFIRDEKFNVFSTPAYMSAKSILDVDAGVSKMISDILK